MTWRKTAKRFVAAIPSFFATASWLALWLVWPRPSASGTARIAPARVTVAEPGEGIRSVYRSPIVFGPPSPVGFSTGAREERELSLLSHRTALPVRLLAREPVLHASLPTGGPLVSHGLTPSYEPALDTLSDRESGAEQAPPLEVSVHAGAQLRDAGFRLPALPDVLTVHTGMPWQVTARIDIGRHGRVQNVFLDAPGVDAEIKRLVEHFLGSGTAPSGEGKRQGRVTVSCGTVEADSKAERTE